jgi:hypothetical protein
LSNYDPSTSLKLDMDSNGNVSVVGGGSKNETDGLLKEAIESKNTVIEINATSSNSIGDKLIIGGSYEGSKTAAAPSVSNEVDGISNESVVASQVVNPNQATAIEGAAGLKKGTIMLHETLEAYIAANIDPGGNSYQGYEKAHDFVNGFENANTSTVAPSVNATKNQNGTHNVKVNGKPLYEVQNYSKNRKK